MNSIKLLRIIGFLEGISYLLLFCVGMPLKYMKGIGEPNYIIGMAHGVLFISYVLLVIKAHFDTKWGVVNTFWAFIASLLPFGTFVADSKLFKKYTVA